MLSKLFMENNEILIPYREALKRLVDNKPINVRRGTIIGYNSVAKEAGRTPGAIKAGRRMYDELRQEIDAARVAQEASENADNKNIVKIGALRDELSSLRLQLAQSMGRELSLVRELAGLRKELNSLTGAKILPIRKVIGTDITDDN